MTQIADNFDSITRMIRKAEKAAGRPAGSVTLIAVSKMQTADALEQAIATGQRVFGENKVQEAQSHWSELKLHHPDLQLHLIGPLQTNKVKDAVALFDCIETLDREKLADAIRDEVQKQKRNISCMIQVNTGEENQKSGVIPSELASFFEYCTKDCRLNVKGLMCIPPEDEPAGLHFALLTKWARKLDVKQLSMGMSNDFLKAIPLGATHVRIGTALFGQRL